MLRTAQGNDAYTIILTATRTRTAISSSRRKDGARIARTEVTRMTSTITREIVNVVLPLTVKKQEMGFWLLTVM